MKIAAFAAEADLVGRRVRVGWDFVLEGDDTLADVPRVVLRRKIRDFQFPSTGLGSDPFVIYDSISFPPAPGPGLSVTDLPEYETQDGATRTVVDAISVAAMFSGRLVEIQRRTTATTYDAGGTPIQQHLEILDLGGSPGALEAGRVYYYQLFPASPSAAVYQATATPTQAYGTNRVLYEMLPSVYRRFDVTKGPAIPGAAAVPEAAPGFGQLRRFVDLFGLGVDSMRSSAEALRGLPDLDGVDPKYLPLIAQWLGWNLSFDVPISLQRNELKSAAHIYRSVGTIPNVRAIVGHYTGWYTQIAEFAQHLMLSNSPAQLNLHVMAETAAGWGAPDDASATLGFGTGNAVAGGTSAGPASLTSSVAQPFPLRAGMTLTLTVDDLGPASVRFEAADFASIGAATAAEVAAVLVREIAELEASAAAGSLTIASRTIGTASSITVVPRAAGLISLDGAPGGRIAPFIDGSGRARIFFEVFDANAPAAPASPDATPPRPSRRRIAYKTRVGADLRGARMLDVTPTVPKGNPAPVELADGRVWLAWLDDPGTASSRLRLAFGAVPTPLPARLLPGGRAPFRLTVGAVLRLVGSFAGAQTYTVKAAAFVDPTHATAAELAAAVNAQLTQVKATPLLNGSVAFETVAVGPDASVSVDLHGSSAARAIGFTPQNAAASGSWDDTIAWSPAEDVPPAPPRFQADPCAILDPDGAVRLFWSVHDVELWKVASARWDGQVWVATAGGVSVLARDGTWSTHVAAAGGLPSNDVRGAVLDADGAAWFATAAGLGVLRPSGTWQVFTTATGLPSNDVRAVLLAPDGAAWLSTSAGVGLRLPNGTWQTLTKASTLGGLPGDDVRGAALAPDGSVWLATSAGIGARRPDGGWNAPQTHADGLPSADVRGLAVAPDGTVWAATAKGLATLAPGGAWAAFHLADGLPSDDVRGVLVDFDGVVWAATAAGIGARDAQGGWTTYTTGTGLTSNDVRALAVGTGGDLWAATAAGVSVLASSGGVSAFKAGAGGLASNDVRAAWGPWSARRDRATGGGGNREPVAVHDGAGRLWLVSAERQGIGTTDDTWLLVHRRFDAASFSWTAPQPLTTAPVGGRATDREPGAMARTADSIRVFFRSDRGGGARLWEVTVGVAASPTAPLALPAGSSIDGAPAPLQASGGVLQLLFRSDRNFALSQAGPGRLDGPPDPSAPTSHLVPDPGSLRRYAGSTSVDLDDLVRARDRRRFGDLLAYTPQGPGGPDVPPPLTNDDYYTRGTIGVYVNRGDQGDPLTPQEMDRIQQIFQQFLPINIRAVLILTTSVDVEVVYPPGSDVEESYRDEYPFIEVVDGATDASADALPDWRLFLSNTAADRTVIANDFTTPLAKTYTPLPGQ